MQGLLYTTIAVLLIGAAIRFALGKLPAPISTLAGYL